MNKYTVLRELYITNLDLLVDTIHNYRALQEECKENAVLSSMNDMRDMYNEKSDELVVCRRVIKNLIEYKKNTNDVLEYLHALTSNQILKREQSSHLDLCLTLVKINEFLTTILLKDNGNENEEGEISESPSSNY